MNTLEIAHRINHPTSTSATEIDSLKELTQKYPYSQVFSILYLKALANENSFNFEEELPFHAYKISDRNKLFELIHTIEFNQNNVEETSINQDSSIEEEKVLIPEIEIATIDTEEIITPINNQDELTQKEEKVSSALDIEIISNVISNVFSQEFEPEVEQNKNEEIITNSENNHISIESPKPFSSWLKANTKTTPEPKINQIIDQFIQDEPSISKPTKEFYSPVKQGQKSIDSSNIIYSETLANILAIQGNYPKAILAYEQLILTIPEKKIYFVQKIKELKEKLNS